MFDEPTNAAAGGQPPQNLPIAPDDIFSTVDEVPTEMSAPELDTPDLSRETMVGGADALSAGVLKRKTPETDNNSVSAAPSSPSRQPGLNYTSPPSPSYTTGAGYPAKEPVLGRIILFILTGFIIVGLAVGGWWVYTRFFKKTAAPAIVPTTNETAPEVTTPTPVETVPTAPATSQTSSSGISNDIKNDAVLFGESIDTDKDGLDDIREQQVGTSITLTDTDGDGLSDAEEVLVWKTNPLNRDTDGDTYADGEEIANGYSPLGPGKLPPGQVTPAVTTTLR